MRIEGNRIYLSRRNLETLLAKLDGFPKDSLCTIMNDGFMITAEEDHVHYKRMPGMMHPETEIRIDKSN